MYRWILLRDCMMLVIPTLCHGWMAVTSYKALSATDQKPESTVPDDQKKKQATPTAKPAPGGPRPVPVSYTHLTLPTIYSV